MNNAVVLGVERLSLEQILAYCQGDQPISLSEQVQSQVVKCRNYLEQKIQNNDALIYGINTGFGSLCNFRIASDQLAELQANLVVSHAAGIGEEAPTEIVKIMMLLKILNMSKGYSGTRLKVIDTLIELFNHNVIPVVYELGSLGASGDLAPLAHMSLPLLGEGKVYLEGRLMTAIDALESVGMKSIQLQAKEGLALLNGTQFSTAYGLWSLLESERLFDRSQMIGALSLDAFNCSLAPFDEDIHVIRPHPGQIETAQNILDWLDGSDLSLREKNHVQDPYAFRCIPQVHGATKDTIDYVRLVIEREVNSVTDNPNIFVDDDKILSGGNFHAQPIALVLDFLAIAMSEIGNISERRTFQLISGKRGLSDYLALQPGLQSGMMIAQYTAASIVNQNKLLCTPASVDSIVSSKGQEDHVSMAANAATKLRKVILNVERILAIEWMVAVQAMQMRPAGHTSPKLQQHIEAFRKCVPFLDKDRILHEDIVASIAYLK